MSPKVIHSSGVKAGIHSNITNILYPDLVIPRCSLKHYQLQEKNRINSGLKLITLMASYGPHEQHMERRRTMRRNESSEVSYD